MSADKGWNQALLLGGIVAAGGMLYYLYSSSAVGAQVCLCSFARSPVPIPDILQQAPRQYDESDDDVRYRDEQNEKDEQNDKHEPPRQKNDDTTASKPLRNPLPPLPERPTAGKRRTASSKPSAAVSKDDSNDTKTSSQAQASKAAEGLKTDREPGQL